MKSLPKNLKYAISGIPVILNGKDVSWKDDVISEGWNASSCYATKHMFIGVKGSEIYLMRIGTKTKNCISSSEVYNKLKRYAFDDVIKLDGGGSLVLDVDGKNKFVTFENRQINTVVRF